MSDRRRPFLLTALAFALACQGDSGDGDDAGAPAELGDQLWERAIAANGIALAVVWNGSIAVVGNEDGGLWLGRFSAEGEPLWSRTEPGVLALAVATDAQRIIYAAGALGLESPSGGRITAYDLDGGHLWSLDDPARTPRALASAPGGGVFAVGPAGAGETGIFIERVLPSGDVQWSLTEDDVAGDWLDADTWTDDMLLITGYREDGSWWVHARTALGDKLWTTELGEVIGPGFPSLAHGVRIHASILAQGEGPRGLVAAVSPWGGAVEWIQPLE